MKTKEEIIIEILARWNPIDVPESIAKSEYQYLLPIIEENMNSEADLIICLENILTHKLGLEYKRSNIALKEELDRIAFDILNIGK